MIVGKPENPFGVLGVHTTLHREFTRGEVNFLQSVANVLAEAIELKKAKEALQESEEKYKTLTESSLTGVFIQQDGKYVFVNKQFAYMHGYAPEELIGKDFLDLIHPDDREAAKQRALERLKGGPAPQQHEIRRITKDGKTIWCEIMATRIEYGGKPAIMGNVVDITERKDLERQLIQSQKMEAIGRLTAGIAHDFNNLISTVMGFAELTMANLDEDDSIYANLKHIWDASNRAADLVRKLLLFSRKQPMEMYPIDLNTLIKDLCKVIQRLIGEDIAINLELNSAPCAIRGDAGSVEQVVMNLVVNARDAMPQGGGLTIKTENVFVDERYSEVYSYARPGEFVCLSVTDTGIGMDEETLQRVFDPFFTTKKAEEGSGLGLSVVYGIVKEHGGWINVYSEPGLGSTFRVYLPLLSAGGTVEIRKGVSLLDLEGDEWRILLVEDDKYLREFAKRALGEKGCTVFEAANAREAVDLFNREGGDFHLIFSDVVLPDRSGLQLAEHLLSHKPGIPVLLSSGYVDRKSQWPAIEEKGFFFLQKPYTMAGLFEAVREAVESGGKG